MPDYPAGFFILPDIRHAGLSGRRLPDIRQLPDIRHLAFSLKNIRHPAKKTDPAMPDYPAGFFIFRQNIRQSGIRQLPDIRPDIRHPAFSVKNIRHPAKKNRSGPTLISSNDFQMDVLSIRT